MIPNPLDPFNGHYRQTKSGPQRWVLVVFTILFAVIIVPPLCYGIYAGVRAISFSRQSALVAAGIAYLGIVLLGPMVYDAVRQSRRAEKES